MTATDDPRTIEVVDVPERHRFEVLIDGARAGLAAYMDRDGRRVFTHTEVDPEFEGQGLAARLATAALEDARAKGLSIVPQCPYFVTFLKRHPEYADLVAH